MKNNLSNHYISNIFSEHPICSWTLDDNSHYISIKNNYSTPLEIEVKSVSLSGEYPDFSTSTDFTYQAVADYNQLSGPYPTEDYDSMYISTMAATSTNAKKYGMILSSFDIPSLSSTVSLDISGIAHLKLENFPLSDGDIPLVTPLGYGVFFATYDGSKYQIIAEKSIDVDETKLFSWYSPQIYFDLYNPANTATTYYFGCYAEFTGPSSISAGEEFNIFVNSYDIGKYANLGLTDGPGDEILPISGIQNQEIVSYLGDDVSTYELGYIPSYSYDNNYDDNGYLLIEKYNSLVNSRLTSANHGLPINLGSESSLSLNKINGYTKATAIFPGKTFLHEKSKGNPLTAEFWLQCDTDSKILDFENSRIFGPLGGTNDSSLELVSGIYIDESNIYLKINDKLKSHYVGHTDRPMLVQWSYDQVSHSLFINGEEVVTIPYEDSDLVPFDNFDYLGFIPTITKKMNVSCLSIYPYKVNENIAKRRFVYGQGTQSLDTIVSSYYGKAIAADYSKSNYYNVLSFPDSLKWESGFFSNAIIGKEGELSLPNYLLPDLIFVSKKDEFGIEKSVIPTIKEYKGDMVDILNANNATYPEIPFFKTSFLTSEKAYSKYNAKISYENIYSYLYFDNFNFLNEKIDSMVFDISTNIDGGSTEPFCLFKISNTAGSYVDALISPEEDEITLSYYDIKTNTETIVKTISNFSTSSSFREKILFNISNIIEYNTSVKTSLQNFFSNRSGLSLVLFGSTEGEQFYGKIYGVGFNNRIFTKDKESKMFDVENNLQPIIFNTETIEATDQELTEIHNYTIVPVSGSNDFSRFFDLDVASCGYWEVYLPASSFHKKMSGDDAQEYYDTGSVQINFDGGNKKGTDLEYATTPVKCSISIIGVENYGDPQYTKSGGLEYVDNVLSSENFSFDKEYAVFNNNIVHIPDYFEEGVHYLKVSVDLKTNKGINLQPVKMKFLQLSTLPNKITSFEPFEINSRFGNPAYVVSKRGTDIMPPQVAPGSVDIYYNQYLNNTKYSGFSVYDSEANTVSDATVYTPALGTSLPIYQYNQNGFQFPVDRTNSLLKLTGSTMFIKVNDYNPETKNSIKNVVVDGVERKIIKFGELVLTDDLGPHKYNIIGEEAIKEYQGISESNTRWKLKVVNDENTEAEFIIFYQNGKRVVNPVLLPMEWSEIAMVFLGGFSAYSSTSYLFISNMASVNNITFHEIGSQALDSSLVRTWNEILYNDDYSDYRDWQYWSEDDKKWTNILFKTTSGAEFLDAKRYYNALTANNIISSEDSLVQDAINLSDETSATLFTDISWTNIVKSPV